MKKINIKLIALTLLLLYPLFISAQNNALEFDGAGDYVQVASPGASFVSGDFTVELWINADAWASTGWNSLVSSRTGSDFNWQFIYIGGSLALWYNSFAYSVPFGVSPTTNKWHHLALVRNGTSWNLYLDGVEVSSQTNATAVTTTDYNLNIGASGYGDGYFDGEMDEIRIWDDARSIAEIRANMYRELPNPSGESDLVAYYKLNESSGTSAADSKGSNTGTLTNMAGSEWIASPAFFGPKSCVSFDGVDDKITLSNLNVSTTSGDKTTLEFWMYWDGNVGDFPFSFDAYDLWFFSSYFGFNTFNTDVYGISSSGLSNKWVHVAAIFNNGDVTQNVLYINGVAQSLSQLAGTPSGTEVVSTTATIGGHDTDPLISYYFTGEIDELRIWNGARTAAEIRENMCRTLTGNETNLVAYYNMDFGRGTEVPDFSANRDDGHAAYFYSGSVIQVELDNQFTTSGNPNWIDDELIGKKLFITTPGKEQERTITDNLAPDFIIVNADFNPNIEIGDTYYIRGDDLTYESASAFNTWLNSNSTSWSTTTNWSLGSVPTSTSNVGLYDYGNSDPVIPTGQTVNNMVVGSSVSTQVSAGENLSVNGNFINYGSFKVASTGMGASGTGSLIIGGEAAGNITFERYVDVIAKGDKWHYVSSPVAGQSLDGTWMTSNSISYNDPAYQFYRYDEDSHYWIYFGYTGTEPENFADATFVEARGYCLSRQSADAISFTGSVRTANVTYAATYTTDKGEGNNMVGNPYTSFLNATSTAHATNNFLTANAALLDDNFEAIYIWDETSGYDGTNQDYKVISNATVSGYTAIDQDYIAPGQAFMVKVVSPGGNLQFNENMQTHTSGNFYKDQKETWPSVELTISNANLMNHTMIAFNENMTTGLDPSYDVAKLKGNPEIAIYTRLVDDNGNDFALQCLPSHNLEGFEISLGVDVAESGVFELSVTQEKLDNYSLILEDRQENTFTDLRWETYFATISESGTGRFYLHFKDATAIEENQMPENDIVIYAANSIIYIRAAEHALLHNSAHHSDVTAQHAALTVTDITGRIVLRREISGSGLISIPVNLETGIYIVVVENGNNIKTEKVFIK